MRVMELRRRVIVFDTTAEPHAFAAARWADHCREAVASRGSFMAAVSGGRTPAEFFRGISRQPDLPWDKTHLFLVDERIVPRTDADSNFRLLAENLLDAIPVPVGNIHPVPAELGAEGAAQRYEQTIGETVPVCNGVIPCFDLLVLGMGEDGHTASLFPGSAALEEQRRLVLPVSAAGVKHERITMTLPLINSSRSVIFLVTGAGKAKALQSVARGDGSLPAARVDPPHGSLIFCVDPSAAQLLAPTASDEPQA